MTDLVDVGDRTLWAVERIRRPDVPYAERGVDEERLLVTERGEADVVSSRTVRDKHRPVLDIDFEAQLLPSATPGHYHLYLDGVELTWAAYETLLKALSEAGIIEREFYSSAVAKQQTFVRLPEKPKPKPIPIVEEWNIPLPMAL